MPSYMTPGKAAKRLKVSRWTIHRWLDEGRFEGVIRGGFGETSPNKIPVASVESVAAQLGITDGDVDNEEEE